jgi:UDPglucose 6-dehydrogenase
MWNPLYGIRGGVPYGGACLPKDTSAFMAFVHENGWEHPVLEAAIQTNRQLEATVPAAASPAEIETVIAAARLRDEAMARGEELELSTLTLQPVAQ